MVRASKELVVGGEGGEDRISQIPDKILHIILHRLKSPVAAAKTSLLSRRWLHLWRCYPFIEFGLSKSNESKFRSFVASTSRRLLLLSDSDQSSNCSYAAAAAIEDFSVTLSDDFQKEDLDQLLLLINNANGLSPVKFVLCISPNDSHPCYSLPVPNWSRTKFITLLGCDLAQTTAFGVHDNRNVVSLGSLEDLCLINVTLSEELLHSFLANAPRLISLHLSSIFGIDMLEVVSSPRLQDVFLGSIYRVGRPGLIHGYDKMRKLKVLSPKLKSLSMSSGLEDLDIDAPNLVSLSWTVSSGGPLTKVNVINLPSNCKSTFSILSLMLFPPQWLRLFFSTTFTKFHHVNLAFGSYISPLQPEVPLDLSQAECAFPPPTIDQVRCNTHWWHNGNVEEVAAVVDRLFWACHPKFMLITECRDSGLIAAEYICCKFLKIDSTNCLGMNAGTSWRHQLKDMKIENDTTGEMMEISQDVIPSLAKGKQVRFMLTWC